MIAHCSYTILKQLITKMSTTSNEETSLQNKINYFINDEI